MVELDTLIGLGNLVKSYRNEIRNLMEKYALESTKLMLAKDGFTYVTTTNDIISIPVPKRFNNCEFLRSTLEKCLTEPNMITQVTIYTDNKNLGSYLKELPSSHLICIKSLDQYSIDNPMFIPYDKVENTYEMTIGDLIK